MLNNAFKQASREGWLQPVADLLVDEGKYLRELIDFGNVILINKNNHHQAVTADDRQRFEELSVRFAKLQVRHANLNLKVMVSVMGGGLYPKLAQLSNDTLDFFEVNLEYWTLQMSKWLVGDSPVQDAITAELVSVARLGNWTIDIANAYWAAVKDMSWKPLIGLGNFDRDITAQLARMSALYSKARI